MNTNAENINAGKILVKALENQGIDRVFCVPGESYLAVLDGLQDSTIETILTRHEGAAAMMAEADGKLTGRPGIALVTRGPGATNASAGIHVAQQDSTPMIIFIGQVEREMRGRDAFQEIDYEQFFGGVAKHVEEINDAEKMAEAVENAFRIAMEGRPGPVVLSLPEDMLYDTASSKVLPRVEVTHPSPDDASIAKALNMLKNAKRPIVIVGGSVWDEAAIEGLARLADTLNLPVCCSFRRKDLMNNLNPYYAGDVGLLGSNPVLMDRIKSADCLLLLGGRLSEAASQSYTLLTIPEPQMPLIHVHPDADELGKVYTPTLGIHTSPGQFLSALLKTCSDEPPHPEHACPEHEDWIAWSDGIFPCPGTINMTEIVQWLRENLPPDAIVTNGAGNFSGWVHRFYHFRNHLTQLASTSGSMGYGLPAAIAAKLRFPERIVVAFSGDGCFQMTMQELATAKQFGVNIIVLVVDNGLLGTIRMHQETKFPGRTKFTELINPDFAKLAKSMGCNSEKIKNTMDFKEKFKQCLNAESPTLFHLPIDPEAITPITTLTAIREASELKTERELMTY